jgi:hypothetical protein
LTPRTPSAAIEVELTAGVNFYGTESPEDEIPFVRAVGEGRLGDLDYRTILHTIANADLGL